jgi:hypothetical protein
MDPRFSFLAQGASSAEPSRYVLKGLPVDEGQVSQAELVESLVSGVTTRATREEAPGCAAVFVHARQFVVYAVPEGTDARGRLAPIACHGELPADALAEEDFEDAVLTALDAFASSIGRVIPESSRMAVRRALLAAKKKRVRRRSWLRSATALAVAAILAAAAVMAVELGGAG